MNAYDLINQWIDDLDRDCAISQENKWITKKRVDLLFKENFAHWAKAKYNRTFAITLRHFKSAMKMLNNDKVNVSNRSNITYVSTML